MAMAMVMCSTTSRPFVFHLAAIMMMMTKVGRVRERDAWWGDVTFVDSV